MSNKSYIFSKISRTGEGGSAVMDTAVLLLAISSVLLSLRAVIDGFRIIKELRKKENWLRKNYAPEENYLPLSKSKRATGDEGSCRKKGGCVKSVS